MLTYKFCKDIKLGGLFSISLLLFVNFSLPLLFLKYKEYHNYVILYYIMGIIQLIYLVYIVYTIKEESSDLNKYIYEVLTKGELNSYRKLFLHIETDPYLEYLIMIIIALIPIPMFKHITLKQKIMMIFSKIGLFHVITGLFITDKNFKINYCSKFK